MMTPAQERAAHLKTIRRIEFYGRLGCIVIVLSAVGGVVIGILQSQ